MDNKEDTVIVAFEPSKALSDLCGFPYIIERRFTVKELLDKRVISKSDVKGMKQGKHISKKVPIVK